jgi:hybrid cluster-associated redox disulfide protein
MEEVTAETHIDQILTENPRLTRVFVELGLPCLVCGEPFWGTVRELCDRHGVNAAELVKQLNERTKEIDEKA